MVNNSLHDHYDEGIFGTSFKADVMAPINNSLVLKFDA